MSEMRAALAAVRPNWLDRVVGYVNPVAGRERLRARMMMAVAGGYTGGSRTRRATSEWRTTLSATADADLLPDLPTLRDRTRDLVRNNPLAGGAINTVVTSVVGTGLMLQSEIDRDVLGLTEAAAVTWQAGAEREWRLWCAECDLTRTQNFYELQDLVFRSALESGDVFALAPYQKRAGDAYGLKLQIIEGDRCSNPRGVQDAINFAGGVEMDNAGAPLRYHFRKLQAGASVHTAGFVGTDWDSVAAFGATTHRRQVIHLYKRLRPGQTRGEPYLAPVIEPLKQLGRYTEAEIMAAVVSGMFTVFTYTDHGQGIDPANQAGLGAETGASGSDKDFKLGNGAIVDLGPNERVETANPGRPNTAFDPFVQAILRQIGVRLELPFEILIKHFTASYSAARAALLEAWKFFRVRRAWLAGKFCQPIYELFLDEAIAAGRLAAPGYFADPLIRMAYAGAEWVGDGMGAIQPLQEVEAARERVDMGLTTLKTETAAYDGRDYRANHRQRVLENNARQADGLAADTAAPPGGEKPPGRDPARAADNSDPGVDPAGDPTLPPGASTPPARGRWMFEVDAAGRTIATPLDAPAAPVILQEAA